MVSNQVFKIDDVVNITRLSESSIYRLIKNNQFPAGKFVGKSKLWLAGDVDNWIIENVGEKNGN